MVPKKYMKHKYHKILSPAKVNLFLNITGKTANGYHLLQSFFHTIDLADKIYIQKSKNYIDNFKLIFGKLLKTGLINNEKQEYLNSIDNSSKNIIIKTLNLLRKKFNIKNYSILLEKNIPVGAGLGGGSSNAAQIINYINVSENLNLCLNDKISIAKEIGADVPFFLIGGLCFVEGIGEKITKFDYFFDYDILLIYPKIITSTEKVYKNFNLNLTNQIIDYKLKQSIIKNKNELKRFLEKNDFNNVLEKSCFELYPNIHEIKKSLVNIGFENVFLSGSGSTVCSLINKRKECDRLIKQYIAPNNNNVIWYKSKTTKSNNFKFEEAILDENY